ncbi:hypothetical protein FOMPIDRAFT_86648 [Fomitopsis schrenkii]|uniref:Uncharacterized protein n=1 Tax=Fomitopsis schrenkii TaxID=2126942 RepID=S8FNT1_FOMSC|nr:hypothetical protein FOMPIDRAFT_86648 [Fomitopsis schrenkii]
MEILTNWSQTLAGAMEAPTRFVCANFRADGLAETISIAALPYFTPPSFPDSITALRASLLSCTVQADPADVASYSKAKADFVDAIWKNPGDYA